MIEHTCYTPNRGIKMLCGSPIEEADNAGELIASLEPVIGTDPQPAGDFVCFVSSISLGSSVRRNTLSDVVAIVNLPRHGDMVWVEFISHTN